MFLAGNASLPSINWNFSQPMEVQITTKLNPNHNHQTISKEILEKYNFDSSLGLQNIHHYYHNDCFISLIIHNQNNKQLYELVGYINFRLKMNELNVQAIKYYNINFSSQPIGKNNILMNLVGKAEINNAHFNIICSLVLKIVNGTPKITNQILEIYS